MPDSEIALSKGLFAVVDAEDHQRIVRHPWHAMVTKSGGIYAGRWDENGRRIMMQRAHTTRRLSRFLANLLY